MNDAVYILDEELLASNGKRFLNYILDIVFIFLSLFILGLVIGILILFGVPALQDWLQNVGDLENRLIFIGMMILYYFLTEGFFGRSIGKFITGTVVVDENGLKPSFGTIFKRTLCRLIPFDGLSFFGSRGWHDSITDTYVVNKKALAESIKMFHDFKLIGVQEVEA